MGVSLETVVRYTYIYIYMFKYLIRGEERDLLFGGQSLHEHWLLHVSKNDLLVTILLVLEVNYSYQCKSENGLGIENLKSVYSLGWMHKKCLFTYVINILF